MKTVRATALCVAAALTASAAQAQIFMCKDASNRTITSDRPIPECADRSMREYGKNGALKREIPAPLTAEEKRQRQQQEERQKAEAKVIEEQRKSDHAMLERYRTEADIEIARGRSLDIVREQVKRESNALADAEKQLKEAQAAMEPYNKKKAQPPASMRDGKIDDYTRRVDEGRRRLMGYEAEIAKINAKFDETVKRFNDIAGANATNPE